MPNLLDILNPVRLTGPILDKELRVASRRKRNYLLRSIYILTLLVVVCLYVAPELRRLNDYSWGTVAARLAEVGHRVAVVIIWFEFLVAQVLAVVLLSNSISDEITHRTLGTLLVTPITSMQLVLGKLASKLWQILILLAISVPLLAVFRVFGGIDWAFIIAGTCITLTAIIHAAAWTLLFSVYSRHAYTAIIKTGVFAAVYFGVLALGFAYSADKWMDMSKDEFWRVLAYYNPFMAMAWLTEYGTTIVPTWNGKTLEFLWPWHCVIMLASSAVAVLLATKAVRKMSILFATYGDFDRYAARPRKRKIVVPAAVPMGSGGSASFAAAASVAASAGARVVEVEVDAKLSRVWGSPVLWREMRAILPRTFMARLALGGLGVVLFIVYGLVWAKDALSSPSFHITMTIIYFILGMVGSVAIPPTRIASEKERQAWPALLGTMQSDWVILRDKFLGSLIKVLPYWLPLICHVVYFTLFQQETQFGRTGLPPSAIWFVLLTAVWTAMFLTAAGLYFSSRFSKSQSAIIANVLFAAVLWALLPALDKPLRRELHVPKGTMLVMNPVVQVVVAVLGPRPPTVISWEAAIRRVQGQSVYNWPDRQRTSDATMQMFAFTATTYVIGAGIFLMLAKRNFRRRLA